MYHMHFNAWQHSTYLEGLRKALGLNFSLI